MAEKRALNVTRLGMVPGGPQVLKLLSLLGLKGGKKAAQSGFNQLLKVAGGLFIASEAADFATTFRQQNRATTLGEKEIELQIKQATALTEGGKQKLASDKEATERFLELLLQDKAFGRSERREARSDALRVNNQNQQLALIQSLLQGVGQFQQTRGQSLQAAVGQPPPTMVNLLRGVL